MQTENDKSPASENEAKPEATTPTPEKKERQTKKPKSQTEPNKKGRPARATAEPAKWTIRGVDPETRRVIDKAAEKTGKSLGEYFNTEIRQFCTGRIKKSEQPPASPTDIKEMVNAELTVFKTEILDAMLQLQQKQQPEQTRKPFLQRLKDLF